MTGLTFPNPFRSHITEKITHMRLCLIESNIYVSQLKELLKCLEIFEKENQETKVDKLTIRNPHQTFWLWLKSTLGHYVEKDWDKSPPV